MEVVANKLRLGEGLRHDHGRPAMAASHITNLRAGGQLGHHPVECRQPVLHKVVEVARSEETRRRTKQARAIVAPGDTPPFLNASWTRGWASDHATTPSKAPIIATGLSSIASIIACSGGSANFRVAEFSNRGRRRKPFVQRA